MKVQEQDIYHGTALSQIVRHQSFKALNSGSSKQGHYLINSDRHMLVKYRTNDGPTWQFTFKPEEIAAIKKMGKKSQSVFLCLVCGQETICALQFDEIKILLSSTSDEQQSITIESPFNKSLRARGSNGDLQTTIPHNAFPHKLFE
jgi:hypothetical protein